VTKILNYDFPEKWPGYMDITLQQLGANDANSVFAGLQCLLAICKVYRFRASEKRGDFDKIVEHCFPQLLNIGSRLVNEESLEAAEMLHAVVKSYKHAIYVGWPLVGWTSPADTESDCVVRASAAPENASIHRELVHLVPGNCHQSPPGFFYA